MIPSIIWARSATNEPPSPFLRGKTERPLKLTFHSSSFAEASVEEAEAIETLRQLSHLPAIEPLDTESGALPHLKIESFEKDAPYIPTTVTGPKGTTHSGIDYPAQWLQFAAQLANQVDPLNPETQTTLDDLLIARAHYQHKSDILVTLSPRLLLHRSKTFIREANPRRPSEAAQIVGLFLRSRGDYTWQIQHNTQCTLDRGLFYWVLVRHRLSNMWRYFSSCVNAESRRGDDILYLGQSILVRCARSLGARDAIGGQFYIPQDNNVRDVIMYHFDYLTLLLSGALDAQARVACRAYGIKHFNERSTSFRRDKFLSALRDRGAIDLYNLGSGEKFKALMTLLYELRNTIHGAGLPTLAYQEGGKPVTSFVTVLPEYSDKLWEAAERCWSPEKWGLTRINGVQLEPYTYAVNLVGECFSQINAIAAATDVSGLFPSGHDIAFLLDKPPNDNVFNEHIRKRLAILG